MLLTPPHPTICTYFQHPLVLFSASPMQEELRSLRGEQDELRSNAGGA